MAYPHISSPKEGKQKRRMKMGEMMRKVDSTAQTVCQL